MAELLPPVPSRRLAVSYSLIRQRNETWARRTLTSGRPPLLLSTCRFSHQAFPAPKVLTGAGLAGVVAAAREGRITFRYIQICELNSVAGKVAQVLTLAFSLVVTGYARLTPVLMVPIMTIGDLLGM